MYRRILLTNDGSDLSTAAAHRAAALASALEAEIVVLRISRAAGVPADEVSPATWDDAIAGGGAPEPADEREEAYPPLSDVVPVLREAGVARVGTLVVRGEPGEAIVDAARGMRCDLVVMSTHGLSGIKRAMLGSVADHVIRNAGGTPVLLCHGEIADAGSYRSILVALDGSELADALVPHAQAVALATGATVTLAWVVDSAFRIRSMTTPAGYPIPAGLAVDAAEEIVRAQQVAAGDHLATVSAELRGAGVEVDARILEGDPGEALVEAATAVSADLVLLATHGRGGVGRALLGSVTDYVSRHLTTAAALIVPPRQ